MSFDSKCPKFPVASIPSTEINSNNLKPPANKQIDTLIGNICAIIVAFNDKGHHCPPLNYRPPPDYRLTHNTDDESLLKQRQLFNERGRAPTTAAQWTSLFPSRETQVLRTTETLSHGERLSDTVPGTIRRGTMGPAERTWVVTRDKTAKCDRD